MAKKIASVTLRTHRPGDIGYITYRHGIVYQQDQGWGTKVEALVARVAAEFLENYDPEMERCWVAEGEEGYLGSVMLVKDQEEANAAKVRLLLVEPKARGLGLGRSLMEQAIEFARSKGYSRVILYTQSVLQPARKLYHSCGFRMTGGVDYGSFPESEGELWELPLNESEGPISA
jgi:GNAT superfamily N-acetyltransferase